MTEVRFLPPAAKFIKKLKDKKLKLLYQEDKIIVIILAETRENFYDELKRYMKKCGRMYFRNEISPAVFPFN